MKSLIAHSADVEYLKKLDKDQLEALNESIFDYVSFAVPRGYLGWRQKQVGNEALITELELGILRYDKWHDNQAESIKNEKLKTVAAILRTQFRDSNAPNGYDFDSFRNGIVSLYDAYDEAGLEAPHCREQDFDTYACIGILGSDKQPTFLFEGENVRAVVKPSWKDYNNLTYTADLVGEVEEYRDGGYFTIDLNGEEFEFGDTKNIRNELSLQIDDFVQDRIDEIIADETEVE